MTSEYGDAIMKLRNKAGLTQRQVAERLGITVQTISNWETGSRTPRLTFKETLSLCKILNCNLEDLVNESNLNYGNPKEIESA